ncbi:hypothetical protein B0T18DRAFT_178175 [Schizothecium vesticola]|uniref:Uncharacterized protein n=1 Tax=Schizothecium vesticola TaxID=314040 RepID=A0AA40K2B4_9PEZI|nr:hypothetical protein B0T18DRAFT_178175 [Schizothecium vesticola]
MASQASRRLPWLCTNVLGSNVKRGEQVRQAMEGVNDDPRPTTTAASVWFRLTPLATPLSLCMAVMGVGT